MLEIIGNTVAVIGITLVLAFWISGAFDDDEDL